MFGIGFGELILIAIVAFLVLGPEKFPTLAKTMGKGIKDLKNASNDIKNDIMEETKDIINIEVAKKIKKDYQESKKSITDNREV
ncbi:twin-arginine translocase subunit TatB [bacterium]|nr:twin-arginine translocase subunit TatB [bacterium]